MDQPVISVVTPFHNTADYLGQCIESVLKQSYREFEYVLVDNCSTDGSGAIAEYYARLDSRIRLIRRETLLTQVQNYNSALLETTDKCKYVKIVQADDFLFSHCLEEMVRIFEQRESIGLVSSYWLKGSEVRGSNFPYSTTVLSGGDTARLYLQKGVWVFGSPTAVMYRSALLQKGKPFYDESQLHEDTDKCMEILEKWDFGFSHQVLSFSRADNESISSAVSSFQPNALDRYIIVQRYASRFLDPVEASAVKRQARKIYYCALAREAFRFRRARFWRYHQNGLMTVGEGIKLGYLTLHIAREGLWMSANPGRTVVSAIRFLKSE